MASHERKVHEFLFGMERSVIFDLKSLYASNDSRFQSILRITDHARSVPDRGLYISTFNNNQQYVNNH